MKARHDFLQFLLHFFNCERRNAICLLDKSNASQSGLLRTETGCRPWERKQKKEPSTVTCPSNLRDSVLLTGMNADADRETAVSSSD